MALAIPFTHSVVPSLRCLAVSLILLGAAVQPAFAESDGVCALVPTPVVSLSEESVYTKGDKTQSHIDPQANAAYRERMAPVWGFIKVVSEDASRYQTEGDNPSGACAIAALAKWAGAKALTDQRTRSVQLNMGRNLSGLALSYRKVRSKASDAEKAAIDAWLHDLAKGIPDLFRSLGNTDTAKGNLRYWNGLAAMSVGEMVNDKDLVQWGDDSLYLGLCEADADGALPIEMHRAARALFYQLYATAPLVAMAAHAKARGARPENECGEALPRIVNFTLTAARDPSLVQRKAGAPQDSGPYKSLSGAFAWLDIYRKAFGEVSGLSGVDVRRPLFDSSLGGETTDERR